ncbi:MAG: glycine cleavage T C-terminal barrel domain-containing protein [Acidimicrobiia bacterium]|nr:glycine cleavage T C-terminal barrel domain-containing protein [Acidimicrobiia bacterium]
MSEETAIRNDAGLATGRTGLVWVSGSDAVTFLDGLLSQSIEKLESGGGARSLLLAPNGKLRAVLWVIRQNDRIGLLGDAGRTEVIVADLARFKIRVDAQLEVETEPVYDIWGPRAAGVAAQAAQRAAELAVAYPMQRSPFPRFIVVGSKPDAAEMAPAVAEAIRIAEGEAVSGLDLDDSTIPQEALDVAAAVDFDKGCYLGQELVARIDSRGRVNRRLAGLVFAERAVPSPPESVEHEGKEVGTITSAAWSGLLDAPVALGLLRREVEDGSTVATATGRAMVMPLPLRT